MKRLLNLLLFLGISFNAHAVLDIDITQGIERSLPIAVVPFDWPHTESAPPVDLAAIISNDLGRSGRFDVMDRQDLPQRPVEFQAVNFNDWRRLGMENILIGNLEPVDSGHYDVSFRLLDIYRGKQIAGLRIPARADTLRWAAHRISNIIFEKLTGIAGAFDTRIAYITVKKDNADIRQYNLVVVDTDGYNPQILLESKEPLLSPAWSPDGKKIAYVSFEGKKSTIFIQDILSGRREQVAAFPGMNSAPAWSPDGAKLAVTLSKDGNAEIYVMTLDTRSLERITYHDGIDTEPAWSPDGQKLAFTSDRTGRPPIYEIHVDGGAPKRISFKGDYNARPRYSPEGKTIALVHAVDGADRIGLLDLQSGFITPLTNNQLDESPSFAPNGIMIIYSMGGARLAAVSADGHIHQNLEVGDGDIREPVWSPFLR